MRPSILRNPEKTSGLSAVRKQTIWPRDASAQNVASLSNLGKGDSTGVLHRCGKDWWIQHVNRDNTFALIATECYQHDTDRIAYTQQERFVKVNFLIGGNHATILDGFGQRDHERPEVFITSGPAEMIKIDILRRGTRMSSVALCLLPEFFSEHMGLSIADLPLPLRSHMSEPDRRPYAFHYFSLTSELCSAARGILAAPVAVRCQPRYVQAKAVELMCLLINQIDTDTGAQSAVVRHRQNLREAREIILHRYSEDITLCTLAQDVGLNRLALSTGFRQLFGASVYEFLMKVRMERAYELLQKGNCTVTEVAALVGYPYASNFSVAFRARFGCSPRTVRGLPRREPVEV